MNEHEFIIQDTYAKQDQVMRDFSGKNIRVAYSGGADSDIVMHLLKSRGYDVTGVFYDTGIEYQATKSHIDNMIKAGYSIETISALRPVPTSNRVFGHPFINKRVSDYLQRLQSFGFDFQSDGKMNLEDALQKFPNSRSALRWWCNDFGDGSRFNIQYNKLLKEFLIEFGLPFKVSGKCCDGAKKMPMKKYIKENSIDLVILGIRKAEGGSRSSAYKSCFTTARTYSYSMYMPLFWWKQDTKKYYQDKFGIVYSDCYTVYGLDRTGCAGCPFGRDFDQELDIIERHEPKLRKGIGNIFDPSYKWTRKYHEYIQSMGGAIAYHSKAEQLELR